MSTYRVLKLRSDLQGRSLLDQAADRIVDIAEKPLWEEVGEIESRYSYAAPEASSVGERFGSGHFLFVGITGSGAAKEIQIGEKPSFFEIEQAEAS